MNINESWFWPVSWLSFVLADAKIVSKNLRISATPHSAENLDLAWGVIIRIFTLGVGG